jgi:H2-forming N5,N10-methylenetetrahydromethanopterin dehydrogenase-like enzyme
LQLFYSNPNRSFYVREITRKIDEQINSVRRELANLLSVGIISSDNTNNRLYYEVNQKYEHYDAFHSIFGGGTMKRKKSVKAGEDVVSEEPTDDLRALGKVDLALLTGQFTRDETSGIDLLIVGDVNNRALEKYIAEMESKESKEIRYAAMSTENFKYRRQINDRFITKVMVAKKQILTDKENLLEEAK